MSNVQNGPRVGQATRARALSSARERVLRMSEGERRALSHEFFALSRGLKAAEALASSGGVKVVDVTCPECGALPGDRCAAVDLTVARLGRDPHTSRVDAARNAIPFKPPVEGRDFQRVKKGGAR